MTRAQGCGLLLRMDAMAFPVRVGRWWFQRRSFSPVPLFILMAVLPPEFVPSVGVVAGAVAVAVLSELLRIWAVGYAGSATRTRGDTVPSLVHAGPFRYLRNPLYVANIGLYTAVGVLFGFTWLSVVIFVYSCVQYHFIVQFEESVLTTTFGSRYADYTRVVPRWLPRFSPGLESSQHQFDLQASLRSEKSTFLSMAAMVALYAIKQAVMKP